MLTNSGIPEGDLEKESEDLTANRGFQESMFFGLNDKDLAEENGENQMWFSESSRLMDWLFEDEDMQCH